VPVIKSRSIQDLKQRVNLHDVVARTVTLRKAGGGRFKGLCPFHSEKTPSFNVNTDKGYYKCFGCGKAGDILTFVMETEGLQFTEAAEALAQRFNVQLEYEEGGPSREERSLRQELFDLHEHAADHYRQAFLATNAGGEFIRGYWEKSRRFTAELADEFKIGFAPPDDGALAVALMKRKYSEDALRQSGLFFVREGAMLTPAALRPRFRGRLMIPIRDHQGRVVAFTARQLELTPADDPAREAKYVNSPETPIFSKSHLLFNLDRARAHAGDAHPFVLVEGQLDALRCWSVGLKTAVAPQGTSITDGQLALLRRYCPQVECFFDSDSAGQKAALRFLPLALKAGHEVRFLTLAGAGKLDPDLLFLERGIAAYDDVKKDAVSAPEFACRSILPIPKQASAIAKAEAVKQAREIFHQCDDTVARISYFHEIARLWEINVSALMSELTGMQSSISSLGRASWNTTIEPKTNQISKEVEAHTRGTEAHLLYLCLHFEQMLREFSVRIPHEWIDTSSAAGRLLDRLLAEFQHNGWLGHENIEQIIDKQDEKNLIATLLFEQPQDEDINKIANEAMRALQRRFLEPQLRQIELEIASKGKIGDPSLFPLLKQRTDIIRQLQNPPKLSLAS